LWSCWRKASFFGAVPMTLSLFGLTSCVHHPPPLRCLLIFSRLIFFLSDALWNGLEDDIGDQGAARQTHQTMTSATWCYAAWPALVGVQRRGGCVHGLRFQVGPSGGPHFGRLSLIVSLATHASLTLWRRAIFIFSDNHHISFFFNFN